VRYAFEAEERVGDIARGVRSDAAGEIRERARVRRDEYGVRVVHDPGQRDGTPENNDVGTRERLDARGTGSD